MTEAWIIDACRTPRSMARNGKGSLCDIHPQQLGATVLRALGKHGVLCFPGQALEAADLQRISSRFGDIRVIKGIPHHEPGMPEVTILSNVKVDGKLIGLVSLRDAVRPESRAVLGALRADGVRRIVLLTGDSHDTAAAVAAELGIEGTPEAAPA